jgi:hypothetical protein
MKRASLKQQTILKEALMHTATFLTPVAICLGFPEFAFLFGAIFIGLPFGLILVASVPFYLVRLGKLEKDPLRSQLTCLSLLLGFIVGCTLVIMPRMEYFEYLLFSMRH